MLRAQSKRFKIAKGRMKPRKLFFNCNICDYKLKKKETLKKHMITKHKDHTCKEWQHNLTSFMNLLKHVAEQHVQETAEEKGEQDEQKVE